MCLFLVSCPKGVVEINQMGIAMNQSIRWIVKRQKHFSVVQLMGSKNCPPTQSPQEKGPVSSLQKIMKQSHFCFSMVKACFSSSRFIFRHLKIWKRLMLCHRTGLKLFTVHHSGFNSAAGWNCGSLLRYAVWNPVVRIFLVCFAAGS